METDMDTDRDRNADRGMDPNMDIGNFNGQLPKIEALKVLS
jgi:hypothetical protein